MALHLRSALVERGEDWTEVDCRVSEAEHRWSALRIAVEEKDSEGISILIAMNNGRLKKFDVRL